MLYIFMYDSCFETNQDCSYCKNKYVMLNNASDVVTCIVSTEISTHVTNQFTDVSSLGFIQLKHSTNLI